MYKIMYFFYISVKSIEINDTIRSKLPFSHYSDAIHINNTLIYKNPLDEERVFEADRSYLDFCSSFGANQRLSFGIEIVFSLIVIIFGASSDGDLAAQNNVFFETVQAVNLT